MAFNYVTTQEYTHIQSTPAANWIIDFPFTGTPIVDCFVDDDGNLVKIIPYAVKINSASQVELVFSAPIAGKAKIIA